jgi:filamentous hemagglutinin family protein
MGAIRGRKRGKPLLMRSVSFAACAYAFISGPATAQALRPPMPGVVVPQGGGGAISPSLGPVRPPNMKEALARSAAIRAQADQIKGYVLSARNAALSSAYAGAQSPVADGLIVTEVAVGVDPGNGLRPVDRIRAAVRASRAQADPNAPNSDVAALLASSSAAKDSTGRATWEGAGIPVQSAERDANGNATGRTAVSIKQNQSRALLTWEQFSVGKNTVLTFDQSAGGSGRGGWTVVNRVLSPDARPSIILGAIKADGTVVVINRNNVIFGAGAQVNASSLLVSTLELGNYSRQFIGTSAFQAASLSERNNAYLQGGLFALPQTTTIQPALLLSPQYAEGTYAVGAVPALEGSIVVDGGAKITVGDGGYLILAAPRIENAGELTANNGQVSLQAGRFIAAVASTGSSASVDPNIRGYILRSFGRSSPSTPLPPTPDDGVVINQGLITSRRGYLSLGAGLYGEVTNSGLLQATTSVSRNGVVWLSAGKVTISGSADKAQAGAITILPDDDGELIPQGTVDEPPSFKTSRIEIGARSDKLGAPADAAGVLTPGIVTLGQNSLILAPSANVVIGRDSGVSFDPLAPLFNPSSIDVQSGATVDVSGVKDVQLAAARNSLRITPAKRNELRDTPNYREVKLDGSFTLNGATLFVDPRRSGVRADGVAWIGSPLIEAGSLASQIPVSAAELMTKGGNVSLGVNLVRGPADAAAAPRITIARNASIDVSGGWVSYLPGVVRTSKLITADGRIVDIGDADPNDVYVDVVDGFTAQQPRFGITRTYQTAAIQAGHFEGAYDEGRDAGSITISTSAASIDGAFHGDAFSGGQQRARGTEGSIASRIAGDPRKLQRSVGDLPSGALVRIGSVTGAASAGLGGDIVVGTAGDATETLGQVVLSDSMLSQAGLSALSLQTSGGITLASSSRLALAPGGTLNLDAGRSIHLDGMMSAPSGAIIARTYEFDLSTPVFAPPVTSNRGELLAGSITATGSPFRSDDELKAVYAFDEPIPHPFDITVAGTLNVAGRWTNDYRATDLAAGLGYNDGGTIRLTVAPKVFATLGPDLATATRAADLSGSIRIERNALLDVSSGGYVGPNGRLTLSAKGGDIGFINETVYASLVNTFRGSGEGGSSNRPIAGGNQSVDFTPDSEVVPSLVPDAQNARVIFDASSLRGFGFGGGGTFTLVAPDLSFGSEERAGSAHVGLDFAERTGFGALDLTTFRSRIVADIFSNARSGNSAFLETTRFRVRPGETLDLTQTVLPSTLSQDQAARLLALDSGASLAGVLAPVKPGSWYQKPVDLTVRGLSILEVDRGGTITGAPQATITASKLLNDGVIRISGGHLVQREELPPIFNLTVPLRDVADGGQGLAGVFGVPDANGRFDENAPNAKGIVDPANPGRLLTSRELLTADGADRLIYFLGTMDPDEGIRLTNRSVTDLSGTALYDPRAQFGPNGQFLIGRLIDGGSILTSATFNTPKGSGTRLLFSNPTFGSPRLLDYAAQSPGPLVAATFGRTLVARPDSIIDLSGASAPFDVQIGALQVERQVQWSAGGSLSALAGGSITGAVIDARGGSSRALGGTLAWFRPTFQQADGAGLSADQIMASGFSSVVALGRATFDGKVDLTLGKSFAVQSAAPTSPVFNIAELQVSLAATAGADATVSAPYIRLASRIGSVGSVATGTGTGQLTLNGAAGIDIAGAVQFEASLASSTLTSDADIRFIGVDDRAPNSTDLPVLNGQVVSVGDLTFNAARSYATTGTGNLQRLLENARAKQLDPTTSTSAASPFLIAALGGSKISFGRTTLTDATPLSAGSYLKIQAASIEQGGFLAAPLGRIDIGSNQALTFGNGGAIARATDQLTFQPGSVTRVSGAGLNVPYGTTTDLTELFFSPTVGLPLQTVPTGEVRLAGVDIDVGAGATVDGRGGGDVFAFEFVSGTGGSRNVLDRINRDRFSSNGYDAAAGSGFQFPDQRQVFAIVPADQASALSAFDPIYSADYGASGPVDLYGAQAGLSVMLDDAPGIKAGRYLLLPAQYALLPGAMRVVENVGQAAPYAAGGQKLLDGSVVVGGNYVFAGTEISDSARRSFTVQPRGTILSYSRIETTSGTDRIVKQADTAGLIAPRLTADAARLVVSPLATLKAAGLFANTAATGGRGAQVDIAARDIVIAADGAAPTANSVTLTDATLKQLNAESLFIGGERTEKLNGTTSLGVISQTITVMDGAVLEAPELILAVGAGVVERGLNPTIDVQGGAIVRSIGKLTDVRTGDYLVETDANPPFGSPFDATGIGSVLRVANGPERLVDRTGDFEARTTLRPATLRIRKDAIVTGDAIALDTSRNLIVDSSSSIEAAAVSLSGDSVRFGAPFIRASLLSELGSTTRLTLRSPEVIGFADGAFAFRDLVIDAPGVALVGATAGKTSSSVSLTAGAVTLRSSAKDRGACRGAALLSCGGPPAQFAIAGDTITLGSGVFRTYGYNDVSLSAANGVYIEGAGTFDAVKSRLNIQTPFIADRGKAADPTKNPVRPDYQLLTSGAVSILAPALSATAATPAILGSRAPGARLAIGTADAPTASVTIDGSRLLATAGLIDVNAIGNIDILQKAILETPGYTRTFGDNVDSVTVSANAGQINLASRTGNLSISNAATLTVDDGVGKAGALTLIASEGAIALGATLNPLAIGAREASLTLDSGKSAFDFAAFVASYGARFGGEVSIRSGEGDLTLANGQTLRAQRIALTADGGSVSIAGALDTSGVSVAGLTGLAYQNARVNGGDIDLYGRSGVSLAGTARLDTSTSGYSSDDTRTASAGDVGLGVDDKAAAISIAAGAVIDVGADRTVAAKSRGDTGDRLVAQIAKDPATLADTVVYRLAEADEGGSLNLRAPVIGSGADQVDVRLHGSIIGASEIRLEGYRRYDLDSLAATGAYAGVSVDGNTVVLDPSAGTASIRNLLTEDFVGSDGFKSVANFVRTFQVKAADGSDLTGVRLRPGVELTTSRDLVLANAWNLGAGVVDQQGALAAGLMETVGPLGNRFAVTPGKEAEVFGGFVTMTYRVGGRVDGEAPVLSLRARGALDVKASISDGFFSFRDRTDPAYMSYQLGGGDRLYRPAVQFGCGLITTPDCSDIASFDEFLQPSPENPVTRERTATITMTLPVVGDDVQPGVLAPYSAAANAASPRGLGTNGAGDPIGGADLFPALASGAPVRSSSIRLVAGTDAQLSANPLHVDRGQQAAVAVSGERSYDIVATKGGVSFGGGLQVRLRPSQGNTDTVFLSAEPADFIQRAANESGGGELPDIDAAQNYVTILTWGAGNAAQQATTRARAIAYFGKTFPAAVFQGGVRSPSGVAAPLSVILAFLQDYSPEYAANVASGAFARPANPVTPAPITLGLGKTAYVPTVVRTGDGSIDIAAAGDVDLLRTPTIAYRTTVNTAASAPPVYSDKTAYQVGGTAVYTAGRADSRLEFKARVDGTGQLATFIRTGAPVVSAFDDRSYQPTNRNTYFNTPVLAVDGGDVSIAAGQDVSGRRDVWAEKNVGTPMLYTRSTIGTGDNSSTAIGTFVPAGYVGGESQRWRVGQVGQATQLAVAPQLFTSGVGALAGGDVSIRATGSVNDLQVALDNSVTTSNPNGFGSSSSVFSGQSEGQANTAFAATLLTLGGGNLALTAGYNMNGGQIDVSRGTGAITIGGDLNGAGTIAKLAGAPLNEARLRVADAYVTLDARGAASIGGIGALGVESTIGDELQDAGQGFFGQQAGVSISTTGLLTLGNSRSEFEVRNFVAGSPDATGFVLPPSLGLISLQDDVVFTGNQARVLFPSAVGNLTLVSGGSIRSLALSMSDADPSLLFGAFGAGRALFSFGGIFPTLTDADLRLLHNQRTTHLGDPEPVRIFAAGSIVNSVFNLAKQARIGAGLDIVDMYFQGQNVEASDVTRITAGRDIIGSTKFSAARGRAYILGNAFFLGGPGLLSIEAGRNLGPFLNSARPGIPDAPGIIFPDYAGGVRTVGNDFNPWMPNQGANLSLFFGIAKGADYDAFQSTYLDPANVAKLDSDLFAQVKDGVGNVAPDRTRPIYAPILAAWLKDNAPDLYGSVMEGADLSSGAATETSAYARYDRLYAAFQTLSTLRRRAFLLDRIYFNELAAPANAAGPSAQQYIRGYRAVQTLFPTRLGYTDNLSTYTTDPATVSADHPLGEPVKNIVNGDPQRATRVVTGSVDLRLATFGTARGGDIDIIGPGGDVIAGSVVRTSDQAARRATIFGNVPRESRENGNLSPARQLATASIPIGYEGVLTLRGGAVRGFTDGDFRLNQSRLFTQSGGDITMWSSNGDLNAGQGPKSAASFPPVTVRFSPDGMGEVDSAGSVSGAGIGAFKRTPSDPDADIVLVAPVGTVDAGDAGVRATGNILVAAARVSNADAFSAGGDISGVPSAVAAPAPALPASAASSVAAQAARVANGGGTDDRPSLITVDVVGYAGGSSDCDPKSDPNCPR